MFKNYINILGKKTAFLSVRCKMLCCYWDSLEISVSVISRHISLSISFWIRTSTKNRESLINFTFHDYKLNRIAELCIKCKLYSVCILAEVLKEHTVCNVCNLFITRQSVKSSFKLWLRVFYSRKVHFFLILIHVKICNNITNTLKANKN